MIVRILVLPLYLYFLEVLVVLHMPYDYTTIHNSNCIVLKQVIIEYISIH